MAPSTVFDDLHLKTLFSPIRVGSLTFPNRLMALPIYTGYAHPGGAVSAMLLAHYTRLAQSGAAVVVVANAAVAQDGIGSIYNLRVDQDAFLPGLTKLAAAIKSRGALACLQLNHAGRFAKTEQPLLPARPDSENFAFNIAALKDFMNFFPFEKRFRLTRYFLQLFSSWHQAMTEEMQQRVIQQFADAAGRAFQAGFDMIELHGANGYLLCQFLSPATNRNPDGTAKSFHRRTVFPLAVFKAVKERLPRDYPIGFRLILEEWVPGGIELPEALQWARLLQDQAIAYVSAAAGTYSAIFSPQRLKETARPAYLAKKMTELTRTVSVPTVIAGRIVKASLAAGLIEQGVCDVIGLGRTLRADVNWIKKNQSGRGRGIVHCRNCQGCLRRVILDQGFSCSQWPISKQEGTALQQKLLSRLHKALWVVTDKTDMNIIQSALPIFIPDNRHLPISHTVMFLEKDGEESINTIDKKAFVRWGENLLQDLGDPDGRLPSVDLGYDGAVEKKIHQHILKDHFGLIILSRRQNQPWRQRLVFKLQGRISILLGPGGHRRHIMVPVDLSPSTRIALAFIARAYAGRTGFDFDFVHIVGDPSTTVEKRWKEMKRLAGLAKETSIHYISAQGEVAGDLLAACAKDRFGTIIMGKRGQSGLKRRLLGSVSAKLMRGLQDQTLILID